MRTFLNLLMFFLGFLIASAVVVNSAYALCSDLDYWQTYIDAWTDDTHYVQCQPCNEDTMSCLQKPIPQEGEIDCPAGYICYDQNGEVGAEPDHCSDGVKSEGETGVDCGGECPNECDSEACPDGTELIYDTVNGQTTSSCVYVTSADDYGNCPSGFSPMGNPPDSCYKDSGVSPTDYYSGDFPDSSDVPTDEPTESSNEFTGGTYSEYHEASSSTVDNGDGTSTTTTVTITTGSNGSSSTSTTTTTTDNSTGGTISTSTTTNGETAVEDNPENYNFTLSSPDYDSNIDEPEEQDIISLWQDIYNNSPYSSIIRDTKITTSGAICEANFEYNGQTIHFGFCSENASNLFDLMSSVLVFCSGVFALFIIFTDK